MLVTSLELLRVVAVALAPVTPSLSARIMAQLGFPQGAVSAGLMHETRRIACIVSILHSFCSVS